MPDPTERVFPAVQQIVGGGRVLPAPASFYLTGSDRLRVVSANSKTGAGITVHWRLADPKGEAIANSVDHAPAADRSVVSTDHELSVGQLLNLTAFASAGAPQIGQTYVMVQLVRGIGPAAVVLGTLLAGYVTGTQALGFPGSPIESSIAGGGYYRTIVGTVPAATTPAVETVPTGARWQLAGVRITMDTATGAFPFYLEFKDDAGNLIGGETSAWNCNAGPTTNELMFTEHCPRSYVNTTSPRARILSNTPAGLVLLAGYTFRLYYSAAVAYTLGAPTYHVREWLEP